MRAVLVMLACMEVCVGEENCGSLRDYNTQCGGWFDLGYCDKESIFHQQARELCPSSCSGCGFQFNVVDDCLALEDKMPQCRKWMLAGKCSYLGSHYGYMMEHCAYSCNGCLPDLYDDDEECAQLSDYNPGCVDWAKDGYCDLDSHSEFMHENCSYSCNGCLKKICAVAHDVSDVCADYKARGWCAQNHYYYKDIINDCQATCNNCD